LPNRNLDFGELLQQHENATSEEEQAVLYAVHGPFSPKLYEMRPAATECVVPVIE
jgi:hypothetical protein